MRRQRGDCGNDSRRAGLEQLSGCLVQFNLVLEQARFMEFGFSLLGPWSMGAEANVCEVSWWGGRVCGENFIV